MKVHCKHTRLAPIAEAIPNPRNPNTHSADQIARLAEVLKFQGWRSPIVVSKRSGFIVKGHGRLAAAKLAGFDMIPVEEQAYDTEALEWADLIADNRLAELAEWDSPALKDLIAEMDTGELDMTLTGFSQEELERLVSEIHQEDAEYESLAARFLAPPFSVLDSKQGAWQERKRWWISLGIQSEVGRPDNLLNYSDAVLDQNNYKQGKKWNEKVDISNYDGGNAFNNTNFTGTSIFDPVLAEIAYLWFCPPKGKVLDPFAGGSVRGIVAGRMGLDYQGVELRDEQVAANKEQADQIETEKKPRWACGDSRELEKLTDKGKVDFVFSCPPYGSLERYSDDERDLSSMEHADFLTVYNEIINKALGKLKANRFAVFVVGDFRDKGGQLQNFIAKTTAAFEAAGAILYNSAIFLTMLGSLPLRAKRIFQAGRKLVPAHQNLLVFYKGDPTKIKEHFPEVSLPAEIDTEFGEELELADLAGEMEV